MRDRLGGKLERCVVCLQAMGVPCYKTIAVMNANTIAWQSCTILFLAAASRVFWRHPLQHCMPASLRNTGPDTRLCFTVTRPPPPATSNSNCQDVTCSTQYPKAAQTKRVAATLTSSHPPREQASQHPRVCLPLSDLLSLTLMPCTALNPSCCFTVVSLLRHRLSSSLTSLQQQVCDAHNTAESWVGCYLGIYHSQAFLDRPAAMAQIYFPPFGQLCLWHQKF